MPREASASLDRRWRAAEERIRVAMDSAWRKTSPQDNPLLRQMRDQVAEAEQRLDRAKAAGDNRRGSLPIDFTLEDVARLSADTVLVHAGRDRTKTVSRDTFVERARDSC